MKLIKLRALTNKAERLIEQYGETWQCVARVNKPDLFFFRTSTPQFYITPLPRTTRNPKENLGDNYVPPSKPNGLGGRWIDSENDPDFDLTWVTN